MATRHVTQSATLPRPLVHSLTRWVFAIGNDSDWGEEVIAGIYDNLSAENPTLFAIELRTKSLDADISRWGAYPGLSTCIWDRSVQPAVEKAIASSTGVVTDKSELFELANKLGIAAIHLDKKSAEVLSRPENQRALVHALEGSEHRSRQKKPRSKPLHLACVADQGYASFLFALIENLLEVHGDDLHVYVLALDSRTRELVTAAYPDLDVRVETLEEAYTAEEVKFADGASVGKKAYTAKPRALLRARQIWPDASVVLSDLDVYYHRSPVEMLKELSAKRNAVIFPQWSDDPSWLNHGVYNSGIVLAGPGSDDFCAWWSTLCIHSVADAPERGIFLDQRYLDMAPIQFEGVVIYHGMDHNVAPWNRRTLGIHRDPESPWILRNSSGKEVGSFHAAGPDTDRYFEHKYLWDQLCAFFQLPPPDADKAASAVLENTLEQQQIHWPNLDRLMRYRTWSTRIPGQPGPLTLRVLARGVSVDAWKYEKWEQALEGYRKWKGRITTAPAELDFWVKEQRAAIGKTSRAGST